MPEFLPGIIVTQHSDDGRANPYFLRSFNLDHCTDFVNGVPASMHAHGHSHGRGEGYAELNFLIPQLVRRIDYRKGPHFADSGEVASAGSADISGKTRLDAPFSQVSMGEIGYKYYVAGGGRRLSRSARGASALALALALVLGGMAHCA